MIRVLASPVSGSFGIKYLEQLLLKEVGSSRDIMHINEVEMQSLMIEVSLLSSEEQNELSDLYVDSNGLDGLEGFDYQALQNHSENLKRFEEDDYYTRVYRYAAEGYMSQ